MAAIITNKLRIFNAQEFLQSINRSAPIWKTGTSYALGDSVVNNGNLFVCITAGTSAGSGSGPAAASGEIVDNDCRWSHQGLSVYNNLYMGIGKNTPWVNDANPPTPEDSIGYGYAVKAEHISMKKVGVNDMSLAIPRVNWKSGSIYTMYEHDVAEEIIPNSYVIAEGINQYNVYKCINNATYTNDSETIVTVTSTEKPTHTTSALVEQTDGYIWKYMYSISLADSLKFLTKDYIPVDRISTDPNNDVANLTSSDVQWDIQQAAAAVAGEIEHVKILKNETNGVVSGGIGYHPLVNGTDTIGASAHTLSGYTQAGPDYTGYHLISYDSTTIEQRKITGWSVNGSGIASVTTDGTFTITGAGVTYIIAPALTVTSTAGSGFAAYGQVTNGKISKIIITNKGSGYTHIDSSIVKTGNVVNAAGGVINVDSCKVKPIISPENGHAFNAIEELGGYYMMIAMKLEYDEQSTRYDTSSTPALVTEPMFPTSGSDSVFRQISIVADPLEYGGTIPATEESMRGPKNLQYNKSVSGVDGTQTTFDVESGSGKILYTENRQPVSRAIDQIEDIKVVFEF